jgi:glycogen synthase
VGSSKCPQVPARPPINYLLNEIDCDVWNSETDPCIPRRYCPDSVDFKYENKDSLRRRFWLREG